MIVFCFKDHQINKMEASNKKFYIFLVSKHPRLILSMVKTKSMATPPDNSFEKDLLVVLHLYRQKVKFCC